MIALITGASTGIGRALAINLSKKGYGLILTARSKEKLEELKQTLDTEVKTITADLSDSEQCLYLYEQTKNDGVDLLINNAGFGVFGAFNETPLKPELSMLSVNIDAVHILTKLFLIQFIEKNSGKILNVASSAGFFPGPLFSSYYASKAYVVRLTLAIREELRRKGSGIYIGALCPGPVDTDFNKIAGIKGFSANPLTTEKVAEYTIKQISNKKAIIIPGMFMKIAHALGRFLPDTLQARMAYDLQRNKFKAPTK